MSRRAHIQGWVLPFAIIVAGVLGVVAHRLTSPEPILDYPPATHGFRLALILADRGWRVANIQGLTTRLAEAGVPSVVVDAGFVPTTPTSAAASIDTLLASRLARWDRQRLFVIGVGRGASLAPFIGNRLRADLRQRVDGIVLEGLESRVSFRHRWNDRAGRPRPTGFPILPELERLRGIPTLCVEGRRADDFCTSLDPSLMHREAPLRPIGGEGDGGALGRRVLSLGLEARPLLGRP